MILFSHARSGLKFILESYKTHINDIVLMPDFICDALIQPFEELGFKIKYYSITD